MSDAAPGPSAWLGALVRRIPGAGTFPRPSDGWWVALFGLALRGAVAAYAAGRFPPADDGAFYHVVAGRIARGLGYTWAWPDGAVTYAAHYPVGYPASIGLAYAVFGARAGVAMGVNAFIGAGAVKAAHVLAACHASRRGALLAALLVALEPALIAYTPALMTEAVAGELVLIAAACAVSRRPALVVRLILAGLLLGWAVLIRPQLVLVAPFVGVAAAWREETLVHAWRAGLAVTALAIAACLPWTLRNCTRLDTCAFVSANGGWNLFIGSSPLGNGGWAPLDQIGVPAECRTVFAEGAKDRCFGRAGLRTVLQHPGAWVALAPKKLAVTFDYGTAAAHYLSASNPKLVDEDRKIALGAAELFGQRVLLVGAMLALGLGAGPHRAVRRRLTPVGVVLSLVPFAWLGWLLLVVLGCLHGRALLRLPSALLLVAVVATTALTHAIFFGAGRYALVCLPALGAAAGLLLPRAAASAEAARID